MAETGASPEPEFELSRKTARRAQLTLNVLVVLSAVAASVFFLYVLHTIKPFGDRQTPEVNVPTSAVGQTIALLRSGDDSVLAVEMRDIDEAPSYRDALSDSMRQALGIENEGRLFRLRVHNAGKQRVEVRGPRMDVRDSDANDWPVQWLAQSGNAEKRSANGRLIAGQSTAEFELGPGETRQLYVFIPGKVPPAEKLASAEFRTESGLKVLLTRDDLRVSTP